MAATQKGSSKEKTVGAANKAKVEFQEYKKRIEHAPAAEPRGPQFGTGATGMPQMPMGWPLPPMTGFIPQVPQMPGLNPALGQTVGERTELSCEVRADGEGGLVVVDAFPLDAVERKLMFGARKGVTLTVVTWFIAHLEHNLGIATAK